MFPHPDTAADICFTRHRELLELAARDRIAAGAQTPKSSLLDQAKRAATAAVSWFASLRSRWHSAPRAALPVSSGLR